MGFSHLDAVAAVVLTLVLVWLHTHGWKLPIIGDVLNVVVGSGATPAAGTPVLDMLQQLLDQLKKRIPHPDDVKPKAVTFEVAVDADGKPVVQPK